MGTGTCIPLGVILPWTIALCQGGCNNPGYGPAVWATSFPRFSNDSPGKELDGDRSFR